MQLKKPYIMEIAVADTARCDENGRPNRMDVFSDVTQLTFAKPDCRNMMFGFRVVNSETGDVPEGLSYWYDTPSDAYCDCMCVMGEPSPCRADPPIVTGSKRHGPVAKLTKNEEAVAEARDELRRAADLLQAVLDHKVYQTDICPELGLNPHSIQYQIVHRFEPYIKARIETVDGLCRLLEDLRTPGDVLLFQVFENAPCYDPMHLPDTITFLPEYDEDVLWSAAQERLTQREYLLLQMICGTDGNGRLGHKEIARQFRITRERTHQIHRKAIRKLRHPDFLAKVFPTMSTGFTDCMDVIMSNAEEVLAQFQAVLSEYRNQRVMTEAMDCYRDGYAPSRATQERVEEILAGKDPEPASRTVKIDDVSPSDMSVRLANCLRRSQIDTLNEIAEMSLEQILCIRNLGRGSLRELGDCLRKYLDCDRPELG